ncbi:hypothetical protein AURDEDRAFT_113841 [Auricularia subglabra TFB-10046 SS5]|nr:hypothetical protein AURDEDRAFT_113841 [Auricularia subglabra TFB-10046 SS5]
MPYLQPKPSPTALVPFPAKIAPPALVCASVTSTSTAQPDRDVAQVRDANTASNPLKVPRLRSRGQSASATVTLLKTYEAKAAEVQAPAAPCASDSSSSSASGRPRRARGQRRPVLTMQQLASVAIEPAYAPAPSPTAPAPAPAVKHEPVNAPGGGLRINLAAIKRTYSESQVTPPVISHTPRLSTPTLPSLIRKKSGEVLKSSLKPFSPSGPNGAPVHLPSPSKSRGMRIDTDFSPITSPRVRQPCKSAPATPTAPKAVHFDHQLEHVKFFLSEQKPAAVSRDGSPTEDSDTSGTERGRKGLHSFAMMPQSPSSEDDKFRASLGLRVVNAAPVVRDTLPSNVDVQAQSFTLTPDKRDVHVGILVRNVAFNKAVAVRFTLDNWQTTSEVGARHVESVWSDPTKRGSADPDMDRFSCTVRLGDFGGRIKQKTMLAAVRYEIPGTGRSFWDNNNGANYQIVFEPQEDRESPSPISATRTEWGGAHDQLGDLRRELEKVVRNEDRQVQQNSARYDWGRGGRWQPRQSASVPPVNAVPFPGKTARSSAGGHRQWQSENTPPRPTFKTMADSRGSPRDTDDADFVRFAPRRGGADSDSELEPRGPKLRKKPGSYFDIPVSPAHLSWGYALERRSPTKEKKPAPVFEIGPPGSASSSDDSAGTARETPTVIVSDSDNDSETERSTTPVPHLSAAAVALEPAPQLLEDRSRTSSSSSVSSTGSWGLPPSPLESATATTAFATAIFGADLTLSPLSMASTPAVSTTTSTSSSSPLESPGSPADEYMPQRSPFVNLDAFFAANASGARPPVDSSNYSYFLDRFCFYTGKDGEARDGVSPPNQAARNIVPTAAVVDDYFGTSVSGSPPMHFTAKFAEPAGPIHTGPLNSPRDLMPAIHATLASANSAETDTTMTTPTVSGHSTPTTPRAGTPTPIGAIVPLSAMTTPTPA